jgi:SAM-dependent methyltransferase
MADNGEIYWDLKFKAEGALWDFIPADSAIRTLQLFKSNNLKEILIPGFGYGRNGKIFIEKDFNVTGIEISKSAIDIARDNKINCTIYHGSVTDMPFDNKTFDGIYCYALIHVLNKKERKVFLNACFNQLKNNGLMVFIVASTRNSMFGMGKELSKNRFKISTGLNVFFYDSISINKEFSPYGLIEFEEIEEPVKFMTDQPPINLIFVTCKKQIRC